MQSNFKQTNENILLQSFTGGGTWESNPPITSLSDSTGFEDQARHQTRSASDRDFKDYNICFGLYYFYLFKN